MGPKTPIVRGNLLIKNESRSGSIEVHCPEQVLAGFRCEDADTGRLWCLSPQVMFENINRKVGLHNDRETGRRAGPALIFAYQRDNIHPASVGG
jgi:hypothetical protein